MGLPRIELGTHPRQRCSLPLAYKPDSKINNIIILNLSKLIIF